MEGDGEEGRKDGGGNKGLSIVTRKQRKETVIT